jgi:hypothetical protein
MPGDEEGENVRSRVDRLEGTGDQTMPFEQAEVVTDGPVIEVQVSRDLVSVVRTLGENLENAQAVRAASTSREEVPK